MECTRMTHPGQLSNDVIGPQQLDTNDPTETHYKIRK